MRVPTLAVLLTLLTSCTEDQAKDAFNEIFDVQVYFVKLDVGPADVQTTVDLLASEFDFEPIHVYQSVAQGFSVQLPSSVVDDLRTIEYVKSIQRDDGIDTPLPDGDGGAVVGDDEVPDGVARIGGPYLGDLGDVAVAVVDTGVDSSDLELNVVDSYDAVCGTTGDCADGSDPNGHGTHVAGTIGAIANDTGVVGVAPGVPIYAVRVLDSQGSGYLTDIVAGLEYVMNHPEIRVVNMSLGGLGDTGPSELKSAIQAVEDSGVVVCIAAGNDGADTADYVPAGYDLGIVVSAYDASGGDNGWAWFSNYGDAVDIAAPGVDIESTWPGDQYEILDGTSMATPHVAGAAAVAMAIDPGLTPAQVRQAMADSAETVAGQGGEHPEGLLDLDGLVAEVSR